ncbi:GAF domain-containing protein [Puniceicoccus vermicola]|uniref:histidine kinase n=1 Tax=Puniceicoccus vermicola TaxID=388746 RepID=A0A7X1B3K6_9BACT|nr:GAF domain-containing protein [Puniceicoccus vermicola]MBC2603898.1 GAF domain-containing protein [Puniceicoccus vermicola]
MASNTGDTDNRGIESLYRISSLVGETEDPQDALEVILDEMVRVFRASSASVALIHPDSRELRIEAASGLPITVKDFPLKLGVGVTGWVALHGEPLLIQDTRNDPRYVALREDVLSELAVPMEDKGRVIGVLNLDSNQPNTFSEDDVLLLRLLTREATRAIQQLWAVRQLRVTARQMETLLRVGQSIVSKKDLNTVLDAIASATRDLIDARFAAIFLLDDSGEFLELHSIRGDGWDDPYQEKLSLDESSVGTAIRHQRQVEVLDLARTEEHHFVPVVQKFGLISMLATPLSFENQGIGVLCAYTDSLHRFNNDEKKVMKGLASLGAVAIENSRLYRRIFETEESLNRNDKLTTLGLLSAEIAHEIRNPLTVMQLLFKSVDFDFEEEDPRHEDIRIIGEKISQLEDIVGRVLDFGKSGDGMRGRFKVESIVRETLQLVRMKLFQADVRLVYSSHPDVRESEVNVNKGQIQQALLNLIINAVDAMTGGGEIRIRLDPEEGNRVRISIADTGCGIDPEIGDRIFESFLTGRKNGSGLGLSIAKRIVRSHRGDIHLSWTGASGTCFELWLPLLHGGN